MILNGICFMIFGIGTLYVIDYHPELGSDLLYRVFHAYNVTLAFTGAVLFVAGVAARVYRGARNRLDARRWR